jgi:pimeloyl-ACP methyl ester carboxylesterase
MIIGELMLKCTTLLLVVIIACGATFSAFNYRTGENGRQRNGAATTASITLQPCEVSGENAAVKEKVLCGSFAVFEDRKANGGRKIRLKILVFPATGQDKAADPLFYIPGGPGSSARERTFCGPGICEDSEHQICVCRPARHRRIEPAQLDLFELLTLQLPGRLFHSQPRKCHEQLDPKPSGSSTQPDRDGRSDVREALGYKQINIIGGSYGTRAAQVYLKSHQAQVRAIILHGVSPTNQLMPRDFPQHTERALNGIMADCAADDVCHAAFPNLQAEARSVLERLLRGPVAVELKRQKAGESTRINLSRDLAAEAIRYMLYQPGAASRIPLFIHLAAQGTSGRLRGCGFLSPDCGNRQQRYVFVGDLRGRLANDQTRRRQRNG